MCNHERMPYYENHLYGPEEKPSSPWPLRLPVGTVSPMRGARAERYSVPLYNDSDAAEQPMRLNRHIPSPTLSPIPAIPRHYSSREQGGNSSILQTCADDAPQRRERDKRGPSRCPPVEPVAGHNSASKHRTTEDFLSIPRAASSPHTPQLHARSARSHVFAEVDAVTDEQQGAEGCTSEEGLVASRPRPVAGNGRERPSFGGMAYRSAANGDDVSAEAALYTQQVASDDIRSAHDSHDMRGAHRREVDDSGGFRELLTDPENWQSPKSLPVSCIRCQYCLPKELIEYLQETSMYRSVPRPHCPECGAQLALAAQHTSSNGEDIVYSSLQVPPSLSPSQQLELHPKHLHVPEKNPREKRSSSLESSSSNISLLNAGSSSTDDPKHESKPLPGTPPKLSLPKAPTKKPVSPLPPCHPKTPAPPPRSRPHSDTKVTPLEKSDILLSKWPYLTLDSLPRRLDYATPTAPGSRPLRGQEGTSTLSPGGTAAPWVVGGCRACCQQASAGLAGFFCCAMPYVLFRERQQLLLHQLRSRYICCAGAFPCCVPPASLRPELYYTIRPGHLHSSSVDAAARRYWDGVADASTAVPPQRHRDSLYTSNNYEGKGRVASSRVAGGGQAPLSALRSLNGVASPASFVHSQTGLPLDGCYSNMPLHRISKPSDCSVTSSVHPSLGTGCCDCISCVDNSCTWDNRRGCCLYCMHPTACCLACPLCCLCCEMTCCMPCALWANRLLIRQHYHLIPDTAVDRGAVCCYTSCMQCCTGLCTQTYTPTVASAAIDKRISGPSTPAASTAGAFESPASPSYWFQFCTTVAASLAAVCCLFPCAACGLAQQRDQIQRLGFPLVVEVPPEIDMI